jgi:hypothetical protein
MTGQADAKAKLKKAERALREAGRLLSQVEGRWTPDEDVLDLLREIEGLTVLGRECVRSGQPLDQAAQELWLYEHGYKRSPEDDGDASPDA